MSLQAHTRRQWKARTSYTINTFLQLARSLVCRSLAAAPGAGSGPQSRLAKAIFEIVILAGSSHKHDEAGMRRVAPRHASQIAVCAPLGFVHVPACLRCVCMVKKAHFLKEKDHIQRRDPSA